MSIENAGRNDNGRDDYLLKIDASEENAGWDAAKADRIAYGWERLRDNNSYVPKEENAGWKANNGWEENAGRNANNGPDN